MPSLSASFSANATRIFDAREKRLQQVRTPEQVRALQQELRGIASDAFGAYVMGQLTQDTPPRVRKGGSIAGDGVTIEKFLYEALPGFWVPALLYRPAADMGKCPALVMPVGHWWDGKAEPMYQRLMRLLARRGVICAAFDSCGQGERIVWASMAARDAMRRIAETQPPDAPRSFPLSGAGVHGFTMAYNVTSSHCVVGDPGYLCGVNQHALTVAAGKRLVDLLRVRRDVAADRIGACGASGGGTDTRFLSAIDDRLAFSVIASILGSTRSAGGGDADQSLFDTVNRGISQSDLVICIAPKPLLIVSASADRHDTAAVAAFYRPFWGAFGQPGRIESGIGEGAHGFPLGTRKLIAEFVLRHMRGENVEIPDAEHADTLPVLPEAALQVTLTGNFAADGVGKGAFELIEAHAAALAKQRPARGGAELRGTMLAVLRESEAAVRREPANVRTDGAALLWEGEDGVPLRAACDGQGSRVALLLHENGADAASGSTLAHALPSKGVLVARLDVRGTGISGSGEADPSSAFLTPLLMGNQASLARAMLHQGRTLTGMRMVDVLQAATALRSAAAAALVPASAPLDLVAEGGMGFVALLAAVLAPDLFRRVVLYRTPLRWQELATGAGREYNFAHFVPGVLEKFDTPDLTRALPAGVLTWINPTDGCGRVVAKPVASRAHRGGQVTFRFAATHRELARLLGKI
jgi:hypothetical protein